MQGGLGKPLGYGSPRDWNGGMPFLLPCIDVSVVVVAVGSPDALSMSVCRVGCWLCPVLLLAVCLVEGSCLGQGKIIECLCLMVMGGCVRLLFAGALYCGADIMSCWQGPYTVDTVCFLCLSFVMYFGLERAYRSPLAWTGFTPAEGTPSVPSGDFVGVYKFEFK